MTADQPELRTRHPEGLTPNQEVLIDLLFTTKTVAPTTKRITLPDGSYDFKKSERPTSPIDFAQEGEFALKMHESNPDAPLSPIYINLRNLPEQIYDQMGRVLAEVTASDPESARPNFCIPIPKAGDPIAETYSMYSGIPLRDILGKEQTEAGRRIVASGTNDGTGIKIRLIDDLATKGETKAEAIRAAEQMGFEVVDILVAVDRQQGAEEWLRNFGKGYEFRSAFTIGKALDYGLRTGHLTQEKYNQVVEYLFPREKG